MLKFCVASILLGIFFLPLFSAAAGGFNLQKLSPSNLSNRDAWVVSHPAPDRVLLTNKKSKQALLLVEYRSSVARNQVEAYFKSDFAKSVISNRSKQLRFQSAAARDFAASHANYRGQEYGELTFKLQLQNGSAAFTERLWADTGKIWQVTFADWKASNELPSAEANRLIDDLMRTIHSPQKSAWLDAILPSADARESVRANGSRASTSEADPFNHLSENECDKLDVDKNLRGDAPPRLRVDASSLGNCISAAGDTFPKMVDATKKAFVSGLEDLRERADANLRRQPCPEPPHPRGLSGWMTYGSAVNEYNQCLEIAGNTAIITKVGDVVTETAKGVSALAQWVWNTEDPGAVIGAMIAKSYRGFECLNTETQAKMTCAFITKAAIAAATIVTTAGTGAAVGAALSGARGVAVLETGLAAARATMLSPINAIRRSGEKVAGESSLSSQTVSSISITEDALRTKKIQKIYGDLLLESGSDPKIADAIGELEKKGHSAEEIRAKLIQITSKLCE